MCLSSRLRLILIVCSLIHVRKNCKNEEWLLYSSTNKGMREYAYTERSKPNRIYDRVKADARKSKVFRFFKSHPRPCSI